MQINRPAERAIYAAKNGSSAMQLFNSPARYGAVAVGLHWSAVALVVLAWTLGVFGDELPKGAARALGLEIHMFVGLLVVVVTLFRLLWRHLDPSPPAEPTKFGAWMFADWISIVARLAHGGLYLLMVAVPVAGIILQFARGSSLDLFGLVEIASPWVKDRAFAEKAEEAHELLAHALIALAGFHAAAALVHHWVFGDRTLTRMLPNR
jgi:cytochrome b561